MRGILGIGNLNMAMTLSSMLECPAGISIYFFIDRANNKWVRNDIMLAQWFEDPDQYVSTDIYMLCCFSEIIDKPIPIDHWDFCLN